MACPQSADTCTYQPVSQQQGCPATAAPTPDCTHAAQHLSGGVPFKTGQQQWGPPSPEGIQRLGCSPAVRRPLVNNLCITGESTALNARHACVHHRITDTRWLIHLPCTLWTAEKRLMLLLQHGSGHPQDHTPAGTRKPLCPFPFPLLAPQLPCYRAYAYNVSFASLFRSLPARA